jgi:hypothetical protein
MDMWRLIVNVSKRELNMHSRTLRTGKNEQILASRQSRRGVSAAFGTLCAALALSGLSAAAGATSFTFSFNSLGNNANSAAIQTYMTGVLGSAVGVTGAIASNSYRGDGFVVGPSLGTSDGATGPSDATHNHAAGSVDTFIMNAGPGSNAFTLNFGSYSIFSISFDWEIFPDASCSPSCANPGPNWPDIKLLVDGNVVPVWMMLGVGAVNPQNIGVASLNLSGAHSLTFVDWPAEVGIDNLKINGCTPTEPRCGQGDLPEPSSLPLAGLALAAILAVRRMRIRKVRASAHGS